jgi:hypothetical protein
MSRVDAVLGLNTAPFRKGLDEAQGSLRSFSAGAKRGISSWAAGLSLVGVAAAVRRISEEFDRIGKLSQRFGVSAEDLQRIGHVAKLSGADIEVVARAMQLGNKAAQEAAQGAEMYADAFGRLRIDAREFAGMGQVEQLMALADAYAEAADKNAALADMQRVLGRSAGELIPMLAEGSDAIRKLGEAAGVVSAEMVEQIQVQNDMWESLVQKVKTFGAVLIASVGGALLGLWEVIKRSGEGWAALFTGDFKTAFATFGDWGDAFMKPFDAAAEASDRARGRIVSDFEDQADAAEDSAKRQEDAFKSFYQAREKDIAKVKEQERAAAEFRMESLQMMEDAEWDAMKRAEAAADAAAAARRDRQQAAEQSRLGSAASALESMLGRVTASDSLQSVGLGFRGVNYGANPMVDKMERMRADVVSKLEQLNRTLEEKDFGLEEDVF